MANRAAENGENPPTNDERVTCQICNRNYRILDITEHTRIRPTDIVREFLPCFHSFCSDCVDNMCRFDPRCPNDRRLIGDRQPPVRQPPGQLEIDHSVAMAIQAASSSEATSEDDGDDEDYVPRPARARSQAAAAPAAATIAAAAAALALRHDSSDDSVAVVRVVPSPRRSRPIPSSAAPAAAPPVRGVETEGGRSSGASTSSGSVDVLRVVPSPGRKPLPTASTARPAVACAADSSANWGQLL